ncbi:MAG TPA: hypothetical protein VM734_10460 [Kofleriaceae bacterium]|nr:hypothetical protein [Kofleriaceae bacterium]
MRARLAVLACVPLGLLACSDDGGGVDADDPLPPPAAHEGFQIAFETTVPAGAELWQCKVSHLPTTEYTPVNHVRSVQTAGVHHMDVMALVFAGVDLAEGVYDCNQLYRDYPSLMEDGLILYAAQRGEQEITLPPDTVANLPGNLLVMQEIHYVNASPEPIEAFSKINIYKYTQPFTKEIWGSAVRDTNMDIPPGDSVQWTRCVMNEPIDLLFLSSHTHALARKVEVRHFDGQTVGDLVYENDDWATPALENYPTPLHVAAGQGFEFQCHYTNPGTETVHWGFAASDEMCQIALVYTPGVASHKCEVVDSSDGMR